MGHHRAAPGAFINALDERSVRDHYELYGLVYGFAAKRALRRSRMAHWSSDWRRSSPSCPPPPSPRTSPGSPSRSIEPSSTAPDRTINVVIRAMSGLVPGDFFSLVPDAIPIERRGLPVLARAMAAGDADQVAAEYLRMMQRVGEKVVELFEPQLFEEPEPAASDGSATRTRPSATAHLRHRPVMLAGTRASSTAPATSPGRTAPSCSPTPGRTSSGSSRPVVTRLAAGDPARSSELPSASKRSVTEVGDLAVGADLLVTDGPIDVEQVWDANPGLVVVTITPFGADGPWSGRPATEFTLQACAGSTGHRGGPSPSRWPRAAGWASGSRAPTPQGALAALRSARATGRGEVVDVAMLDCMATTMATFPSVFASFLGWPAIPGTGRSVEVPSIEPTADGYAVSRPTARSSTRTSAS